MKPIPPEVSVRWAPMWGRDALPERPWWSVQSIKTETAAGKFVTWRRVDGQSKSFAWDGPPVAWAGSMDEWNRITMDCAVHAAGDDLARIDAEHPLPAPPPMPGQVWHIAFPDGADEFTETVAYTDRRGAYRTYPRGTGYGGEARMCRFDSWPPAFGILVAGPTPWGRDVPWSPVEGK